MEQRLVEVPKWEPCRRRRYEWRAQRTRQAGERVEGGDAHPEAHLARRMWAIQILLSLSRQAIRQMILVEKPSAHKKRAGLDCRLTLTRQRRLCDHHHVRWCCWRRAVSFRRSSNYNHQIATSQRPTKKWCGSSPLTQVTLSLTPSRQTMAHPQNRLPPDCGPNFLRQAHGPT
jgi:hypothetical protein